MTRRMLAFAAIAMLAAVVFVRLGLWQLDRLGQRRARNRQIAEQASAPAAAWSDTTAVRYRRVRLTGRPDYEREVILVGRSRQGSPGVNIVTPLQLPGSDTAVLVNRGWVYSPDATKIDRNAWREGKDTLLTIEGYVEGFAPPGPGDLPETQWIARRLSYEAVSARLPYPLAPAYVVAVQTTRAEPTGRPARAPPPTVNDGPHLGYAVQWFLFAIIAIVGAGIAITTGRRDRQRRWARIS